MNVCSPFSIQSVWEIPAFSCRPVDDWIKSKASIAKTILDKHTDMVSSAGILAITTCLLAAKIFKQTPDILPRIAKVVYNYGGLIWLNVQARDLIKCCKDFIRSFQTTKMPAIVETAAKVFVTGANILLTCVIFAGSVISAVAFPEASLVIALYLRSFSLSCLFINIASVIRDYFANEDLLKKLEKIEADPEGNVMIGKVMVCFLEIIKDVETPSRVSSKWKKEWKLADRLVRQIDSYTLETFKESLAEERKEKNPFVDALKIYYGVKDGLIGSQAVTKANLCLTTLGYISMGICRAFPESLVEMVARWSMSVLYTDELIQRKLFQGDLAERIN